MKPQKKRSRIHVVGSVALVLCTSNAIVFEAIGWGTPVKIMPLGDSITKGANLASGGGYRIDLYTKLTANGDVFDFVGSQSDGPSTLPDKDHEGHNGWMLDRISTNDTSTSIYHFIPGWQTTYQPDVILLLAGTNEFYNLFSSPYPHGIDSVYNRYSKLVDRICADQPSTRLISGSITYSAFDPIGIPAFYPFHRELVLRKFADGKNVYYADLYSNFSPSDVADGVHPNAAGYSRMANVWFDALSSTLKSATGLYGEYCNNIDFSDVRITRLDNTVNFNWGTASPTTTSNMITPSSYAVRWSGYVIPQYSETYTFYAQVNGGARLWVNNQLLVDHWSDQGANEWSGTIALTSNQQYVIRMEYLKNTGSASAVLSWSSASRAKQVIPSSQLTTGTNHSFTGAPTCSNVVFVHDTVAHGAFPLTITMSANATQVGAGTIAKVEFFRDSTLIGQATPPVNGTIWTYAWNNAIEGSFDFTARATDSFGHTATTLPIKLYVANETPRNPENPADATSGLQYKYYEFSDWLWFPNFAPLTPKKTGITNSVGSSLFESEWLMGIVFTGYINAPTDGLYTFFITADHAGKVMIGNRTICSQMLWPGVGYGEQAGYIYLKAGKHSFRVEYCEMYAPAAFTVKWQGTGIAKQLIPSSALYYSPGTTPVKQFLQTSVNKSGSVHIEVYTLKGRFVGSFQMQNGHDRQQLLKLSQGSYIVKVIRNNKVERIISKAVVNDLLSIY